MNDRIQETITPANQSISGPVCLLFFVGLFFLISCKEEAALFPHCTDPLGSENKVYKNGNVFCYKENYHGCFTLEMTTSTPVIRAVNFTGKELGMIIDVGEVKCLSDVKVKPVSGYVYALNAVLGHGYIVKLPDGTYGRFFIDSWRKSTTNVVMEMNITRQYSF